MSNTPQSKGEILSLASGQYAPYAPSKIMNVRIR